MSLLHYIPDSLIKSLLHYIPDTLVISLLHNHNLLHNCCHDSQGRTLLFALVNFAVDGWEEGEGDFHPESGGGGGKFAKSLHRDERLAKRQPGLSLSL